MKVLVDTNVLLDVLVERAPFHSTAARVWAAVEAQEVSALASALSFTTIFYVARKVHGRAPAHAACVEVARVFRVAAVVADALASGMHDFEDAVQAFAAVRAGATHIVSRDADGFRGAPLPVFTPDGLLDALREG